MRPPEFTGGNLAVEPVTPPCQHLHASMRPPEFTGGNLVADVRRPAADRHASMRPPEFTGGNLRRLMAMIDP